MNAPAHWDTELQRIEQHARHLALSHKATAVVAVAVDDARKRDYFLPRLQRMLDQHTWARYLTIRVVPVLGGDVHDLRAESAPEEPR